MKGSIATIESLGLLDGPGIRTVVFMNGCPLRCLYCHNPEMWELKETNYSKEELITKILNYKPYYKNNGGVTFSGGEPLLQTPFLLEVCQELKKENIHIALDTSGVTNYDYEQLLEYIDLVIFDIKGIDNESYKNITGLDEKKSLEFLNICQSKNIKMWLRQVIVPGINDNKDYIVRLKEFIKPLKNIEKIELLPYHSMAIKKYKELNIPYKLENTKDMDKDLCLELEKFLIS